MAENLPAEILADIFMHAAYPTNTVMALVSTRWASVFRFAGRGEGYTLFQIASPSGRAIITARRPRNYCLAWAAREGHEALLLWALGGGTRRRTASSRENIWAEIVVASGRVATVQALVQRGWTFGSFLLQIAIKRGDIATVALLQAHMYCADWTPAKCPTAWCTDVVTARDPGMLIWLRSQTPPYNWDKEACYVAARSVEFQSIGYGSTEGDPGGSAFLRWLVAQKD
jgi:hypothetical protein